MSGATSLENAFQRFERAAHDLEAHQATLQSKVTRLERKLMDSNRQLEAVLDALDSGVAVVSRNGGFLRTNEAFARMRLSHGDAGIPAIDELVEAQPAAGGSARFRHETASGARDFAATMIPVGDEEGTRVLTVQDITEIRREEEQGGRRRRLKALGRMAAELAHEVRNPLGSIRLFACMLHEDLDGQGQAMTEQILAATAGLEATVSNLLAFAAPARGAYRRIDVAELAREACSLLAPVCSVRGVTLHGPAATQRCPITADPEGIRQVLLNLIVNSLAATDRGGVIGVSTEHCGGRLLVTVSDDGRGIAAEDLPLVFDPFFSRTEGGTGLGLPIVHGILERHGGEISLESRIDEGTRARVELPVDAETFDA